MRIKCSQSFIQIAAPEPQALIDLPTAADAIEEAYRAASEGPSIFHTLAISLFRMRRTATSNMGTGKVTQTSSSKSLPAFCKTA
jgi:hypothetical protein